jgi:pimeloyl-ACP methyl ester carboxylesterase
MNATTVPTGTVVVDELRIRYTDSGADGPIILLTSPWPESLFAFRRVWPALARTARLVSIDLPGFGHSEGRSDVFTPSAMGEFLLRFIAERGLGRPHLVAPDVGTSAALFLAARHPDAVRSLVVGGGAAAFPLEVTGTLADIIAAPGIEVFEAQDIGATIGATVEPVAPRSQEPDVWEDYVSAYENGRFAQSTQYVRSYPEQLPLLRDVLPEVRLPVRVFGATGDPLVPLSNARYLAERVPGSALTVLPAGHFAWEEVPGEFASMVVDWVTRAETGRPARSVDPAGGSKAERSQ